MARISPVSAPYEPEMSRELAKWMGTADREPLLLFRTLVRNPSLASRARVLGAGLLGHGTLPAIDRELVIARTCALSGCVYEWGVHAALFGTAVGLTEDQVTATVTGTPGDTVWLPRQTALLRAVDELNETSTLSDDTWKALEEHLDAEQLLEFLMLCGWYRTVSYLANTLHLTTEPWAAPYPGLG